MSDSGRESLPGVCEALSDVREWSGGTPKSPFVVGRHSLMSVKPSRMFESGQEDFPDIR